MAKAWNKENRFTGWTDVPLSDKGLCEAHAAGELLKLRDNALIYFHSVLKRAVKTPCAWKRWIRWILVEHLINLTRDTTAHYRDSTKQRRRRNTETRR